MTPQKKSEIQELIAKSGNSFHSRVAKLLRDEKWNVLVSPYYSDNFTDKPREIDIIAEKQFPVRDYFGVSWLGTLKTRLFIECKYAQGDTVFWFDTKDKLRAVERITSDTGMPHPDENAGARSHHYFADLPVAKLFSSERSRGEENEIIGKAINQNLNAVIYYRGRSDIYPSKQNRPERTLRVVSYPLIVVNTLDNFYRTEMNGNPDPEPLNEPFQLEVNYAYLDNERKGRSEYFLIDVVSIEKLSQFLAALEQTDIQAIGQYLSRKEGHK